LYNFKWISRFFISKLLIFLKAVLITYKSILECVIAGIETS